MSDLGDELILNGGFTGSIDNWFVQTAGFFYRSNDVVARVAESGAVWYPNGQMNQNIVAGGTPKIEAGKIYCLSITLDILVAAVADYSVILYDSVSETYIQYTLVQGVNKITFTAAMDYDYLMLRFDNGIYDPDYEDIDVAVFDDISLKVAINYYKIYRGQDGHIDYDTHVAVMGPEDTQVAIAAQDLPPGTKWHYIRRLVLGDCGRESPDSPVCIVRIGADGNVLGSTPNPPDDLTASPIIGGRIRLRWRYSVAGQQAAPAGFVIFLDTFDAAHAAVPAGGGLKGDYGWTSGVLIHGTVYRFCVRAYTDAGELSDNTAFVAVQADSQGPPAITGLTAEQEDL
jgi:hypothetical protein